MLLLKYQVITNFEILNKAYMNHWIDHQEIENALKKKSISELTKSGVVFCVSDNYEYCILLRKHSAWCVPSEGWRDANEPPSDNSGRWVLNFYKLNSISKAYDWFKLFVPEKYPLTSINAMGDFYHLVCDHRTVIGKFSAFDSLMWDLMTGNAETEIEIERKFELLKSKP